MAFAITESVDGRLTTREVGAAELLLGRGPDANIILDNAAVAPAHARITQEDRNFVITDLGSETGTFVNGEKIQSVFLADKDTIRIGPFELLVGFSGADDRLELKVTRMQDASAAAAAKPPEEIDYDGAYRLERDIVGHASFPRWMWATLVGGVLLAIPLIFFFPAILSPGPVSQAHSFVGNQCSTCHVFPHGPSNQQCQGCHNGPVHHANQTFEPSCVSCHAEHRTVARLARVDNRDCTQCHRNLTTKDDKSQTVFVKRVTDFSADHPQFALSVKDQDDSGRPLKQSKILQRVRFDSQGIQSLKPPVEAENVIGFNKKIQGAIRLNHYTHLNKPIARKGDDDKVQLSCESCHALAPDGKRMQKITFAEHCAGCHQQRDLKIDPNADEKKVAACTVPHGSEERVRDYLKFFFAENQCEPLNAAEPTPRLLLSKQRGQFSQAVTNKVQDVENMLYRDRGCAYCHLIDRNAQPLPKVIYAKIPDRWFDHADFDHKKHRMVTCEECHRGFGWRPDGANLKLVTVGPRESTQTEDILIPSIEICRNCHRDAKRSGAQVAGSATTNCGACHTYHDKSKEKEWKGKLNVQLKPAVEKTN